MANIVLIGTCDTKLEEILYLREYITQGTSVSVTLIDVGRNGGQHESITISQQELLSQYGGNGQNPADLPRGEYIQLMSSCATKATKDLFQAGRIHGIVAAGGSCGTSLAAAVMRDAVPIGFPKLIVSTVASGDTGHLVGETDIGLMYSVVDVAGLNEVLRDVLSNAAAAIAGAAVAYAKRQSSSGQPRGTAKSSKRRIGATMFGVTTPGVDAIRHHLESNYDVEVYVFHATGHGGKAMERLVREGRLDAVLDLTTTELCDLITGGVMSAGPHRLEAAAEAGIPYIVSLGATDMTNFGPKSTVPPRYQDRQLFEHNPEVTLMRTSKDESKKVGEHICDKLTKHAKDTNMIEVWIPRGGISKIAVPGGPFEDAEADAVLFDTVKNGLEGSGVRVIDDKRDVNDPGFAKDIAESLARKMGL
ncbi:hypothetical protein HJFPF1_05549 [Paramyrothecium foliicola]|nr:hypothetical protein HJFPF1_05549 [Paramyrothecium foliicola]